MDQRAVFHNIRQIASNDGRLQLYDFRIEHCKTDNFGHADILSRLINSHVKENEDYIITSIETETVIYNTVEQAIEHLPVTNKMIADVTSKDDTLKKKIIQYVNHGWPKNSTQSEPPEIMQFFARRDSIYSAQKILMHHDRIIIPTKLQRRVLHQLHKGHPEIARMRSLARTIVYWPNIDQHNSTLVQNCHVLR